MITFDEWCEYVVKNPEKLFTDNHATTYIPLERKIALIDVAVKQTETNGKTVNPYCIEYDETGFATVDTIGRYLFLMNIYLIAYFDVDLGENGLTLELYNRIMRGGYQPKLNRLAEKSGNYKVRRAVVEQQNDFKLFEKIFNKSLSDEIQKTNDPYKRMQPFANDLIEALLNRMEMDISPEKLQEATEELKNITAEIESRRDELNIPKEQNL